MAPARPGRTVREPVAAGTFYEADAARLRTRVEALLAEASAAPSAARLLLAPHAGGELSDAIAAAAWSEVAPPGLVVVIAPSHHGIGADFALPRSGSWRTPLGDLEIDEQAAAAVLARSPLLRDDWRAHAREHAIEVQLPFLHVRAEQVGTARPRLIALSVGTLELGQLLEAGEALAGGLAAAGRAGARDALLVVSSDMSEGLTPAAAADVDLPLLELFRRVDPEALHEAALSRGAGACGIGAAVVGLAAARRMGAAPGRLLRYGHPGDGGGDRREIVACAALVVPSEDSGAA